MSDVSIQYLAGLFDGEGCIYAQSSPPEKGNGVSPRHRVRVSVTNTHREVLELFAQRWGGSVRVQSRVEGRQVVYSWWTDNLRATAILSDLLPYLIIKRRQAELALELASLKRNRGRARLTPDELSHRDRLCAEIKRAKVYDGPDEA